MKNVIRAIVFAVTILFGASAFAQSGPGFTFTYGYVPTVAQWQTAFTSKQDYLGAPPIVASGGVMTGPLITAASSATAAGLSIPPGVAPTSPNNGNVWETAAGIFAQISGATLGPLLGGVQAANTILGNGSGTGVPVALAIPSCSGAANGIQWVLNTGFQCGTIVAAASSVAIGTTSITGGSIGNILAHVTGNLLGELTTSGSGTVVALATGATLASPIISSETSSNPTFSGTISGTYTVGGTPSIAGSAITSGTISGSWMAAVNLAATGNGGVTGTLPITSGGTGQIAAPAAISALMPVPTRIGDIAFWNGTIWTTLAGNNSGMQVFSENASGVPAWLTASGTGTVTSAVIAAGSGISLSGTCTITSTGTCTVTGAVISAQGRITLAANTPVMGPNSCSGSPCANQTTLRYDCSSGAGVPYFNGSIDLIDTIASCEVTDAMVATATAGQVVGSQVFDVWWVHGGANRICLAMSSATGGGGGWASDTGGSNTSRGTGYTVIDQITRPYATNKNALSNCFNGATNYGSIAANQGTYLGTVYANANGQISYIWGSAASGGGAALFGIWNANNQVEVKTTVSDTTTSWIQTGTSTIRAVHSSTANRVSFVTGLPSNGFSASYQVEAETSAQVGSGSFTGTCLNGVNCFDAGALFETPTANNVFSSPIAFHNYGPVSGFNFVQATEENTNNLGMTWFGGAANMQLNVATRQ